MLAFIAGALHSSPAPAAQAPFVGLVSEDAFGGSPGYRENALKRIAGLRVGTLRQTLDWAVIERTPGQYNWARYDAWMEATARRGIRVLPVLFNAPSWASSRPVGSAIRGTYPPTDFAAFAAFAAQAARRYGPGGSFWAAHPSVPRMPIRSWQVWNEPNLHIYWLPRADAGRYVALLRATSAAIKLVDPGAEIVTGGMPQSRLGVPLTSFIKKIYAAGGIDAFDSLAVNAYSKTPKIVLSRLKRVRERMNNSGDSSAGLWVTEIGWADRGRSGAYVLGPEGQARAVGSVLRLLSHHRSRLKLKSVIYFNWRDAKPYPGGKDFWGLHTGLLTIDGKAKPVYRAFKSATRKIR